ncbi:ABC transporter permease [Streptococcus entericus]|uniref:ABC transporter permease n=1 Tax=Streptococcus entericus TaxID=155680 RepID=UPI00035C3FDA|nr:ABC transporter permease [Streptococcus entericus]
MQKKSTSILDRWVSLLTIIGLLVVWELAGQFGLLPKFILPTPLQILQAFVRNSDQLMFHTKVTLLEAMVGLSYGVVIACLLALVMDAFPLFHKAIYPLLVITQTVPTIAIAPILVLWLGYGMAPKIVLIVLTTTFPIVVAILDGFRQADEDTIQLLRLMNASKWQILWHVKIPTSLSYFYAGLRVSVSYAFISAVVSEWLGGFEGLGVYMIRTKKLFQYDTMFAIILLTSLVSLGSMQLVKWSEKYLMKWKYIGEKK